MKKILAAVALVSAFLSATGEAHAFATLEGRYWSTTLDSSIKTTDGSVIGTDLDLVNDLGFDANKNFPELRLTLGGKSHKARYGYLPLEWKGSTTLTRSINYGGNTHVATTKVDSNLKVRYHRLGYQYDFLGHSKDAKKGAASKDENSLGFIFDIKYFIIDARVDTVAVGYLDRIKAAVPTIGLAGTLALPAYLSVNAEATGVSLNSSGTRSSMIDAEGLLRFKPLDWLAASVGYRLFKIRVSVDHGKDSFDLKLKGPFAQLALTY